MKNTNKDKNIKILSSIDPSLNQYDGNVIFADKIKNAKAILSKVGMPKVKQKN